MLCPGRGTGSGGGSGGGEAVADVVVVPGGKHLRSVDHRGRIHAFASQPKVSGDLHRPLNSASN
jgi:hypothetical protein